jgi:hypothetical protein
MKREKALEKVKKTQKLLRSSMVEKNATGYSGSEIEGEPRQASHVEIVD